MSLSSDDWVREVHDRVERAGSVIRELNSRPLSPVQRADLQIASGYLREVERGPSNSTSKKDARRLIALAYEKMVPSLFAYHNESSAFDYTAYALQVFREAGEASGVSRMEKMVMLLGGVEATNSKLAEAWASTAWLTFSNLCKVLLREGKKQQFDAYVLETPFRKDLEATLAKLLPNVRKLTQSDFTKKQVRSYLTLLSYEILLEFIKKNKDMIDDEADFHSVEEVPAKTISALSWGPGPQLTLDQLQTAFVERLGADLEAAAKLLVTREKARAPSSPKHPEPISEAEPVTAEAAQPATPNHELSTLLESGTIGQWAILIKRALDSHGEVSLTTPASPGNYATEGYHNLLVAVFESGLDKGKLLGTIKVGDKFTRRAIEIMSDLGKHHTIECIVGEGQDDYARQALTILESQGQEAQTNKNRWQFVISTGETLAVTQEFFKNEKTGRAERIVFRVAQG